MSPTIADRSRPTGFWKFILDDSLSLALFGLFVISLASQSVSGWRTYNDTLKAAHEPLISFHGFLLTGTFQNAVFSNWQAAVLKLAGLVSFSSVLRQRGAAHSRKPTGDGGKDGSSSPVRNASGVSRRLRLNLRFDRENWFWDNSLSLSTFALFVVFFSLHIWTSNRAYNEEQALRHLLPQPPLSYLTSANLWFDTFETWEARFFIICLYVVMSIFLRQERSPESKKLSSANTQTGNTITSE